MDDSSRRRRQNEPPAHPSSASRYPNMHDPSQNQQQQQQPSQQQQHQQAHQQQSRRAFAPNSRDSYHRPASIAGSSSAGGQRMGGSAGYGGYYQDQPGTFPATGMTQSTMGYHQSPDYGQTEARQAQGFGAGTYNPAAGMMYNVQQPVPAQSAGVYDSSSFAGPRQSAAGLGMDVAAPYFSNEPTNSAAASALQSQTGPAGASQAVYQQPGLQSYGSSSMAATMGGAMATQSSGPDVTMDDDYHPPATTGTDGAYSTYQNTVKQIFQHIQNGALETASQHLLEISAWLLGNVVDLGLTADDTNLHSDRIKLWNDFNHAWLALFQKQKEMMESGQQLGRGQNLITQEGLEKMGKELVRLCDAVEPHGLVDYQYGVWEEQIIEILEECLDLYEPADDSNDNTGGGSSSRRR